MFFQLEFIKIGTNIAIETRRGEVGPGEARCAKCSGQKINPNELQFQTHVG